MTLCGLLIPFMMTEKSRARELDGAREIRAGAFVLRDISICASCRASEFAGLTSKAASSKLISRDCKWRRVAGR